VRVVPLDNLREDARSNRYLIAPEQLLAVDRSAREAGLEVLGFFHSHPDHPPEPSGFDREHAWPWYSYLIVAVERGRNAGQRAWRLREDRSAFDEEPIETPPGGDGAIR
jgi:proteasome lid subunit RPN8/RPN11